MAILFHCDGDDGRMLEALRNALPSHEVRCWPDTGTRTDIRLAVVWLPPPDFFDGLVSLKAVLALSAGVDQLLQHAGLPADIPLVRLDDAGMGDKMAEFVLYAVLHAQRGFPALNEARRQTTWLQGLRVPRAARFDVGILGAGAIGTRVAVRLAANGYPVSCWSRNEKWMPEGVAHHHGESGLADMLAKSQVLVCLLPLTDATRAILSRRVFDALPAGAFVVNVGRGEHLVEPDLLDALDDGRLSGALLDVFAEEPLPADHPFWRDPRIVVTPHLAAPSGIAESIEQVIESIELLNAGQRPRGLVDRTRGY